MLEVCIGAKVAGFGQQSSAGVKIRKPLWMGKCADDGRDQGKIGLNVEGWGDLLKSKHWGNDNTSLLYML